MSYYFGSIIQGSTGNQAFILPFTPQGLKFTVSQLLAGPENDVAHISHGSTDGVNSVAHSILVTSQTRITRRSEVYCVTHYAIVAGATNRVISATLVSIVGNTVTLNFDRASLDYEINMEAFA